MRSHRKSWLATALLLASLPLLACNPPADDPDGVDAASHADAGQRDAAAMDRVAADLAGQDAAALDSAPGDLAPALDAASTHDVATAVDAPAPDRTGVDAAIGIDSAPPVDAGAGDPCLDTCLLPVAGTGDRSCGLWDEGAGVFLDPISTGDGHLHNQARLYNAWLRRRLMPEGGIMRAQFTTPEMTTVSGYAGTRDSPIWTGIYMGAEALRLQVTGSPDARDQIAAAAQTLHRWWNISGDLGYLARYAAPADAAPAVLAIFDRNDFEDHFDVPFEGGTWHWKGNISRDQYQGAFFGAGLAYDATDDEAVRALLREDVVRTVERLMIRETRTFNVRINGGIAFPKDLEVEHIIFTDDETPDGVPELDITISPFNATDLGFVQFWPDPMQYLGEIPGLGLVPNFYLRGQAIQLAGMFAVALHVTEGVPAYAGRRALILAHYLSHVDEWLELASGWSNTNVCGGSYHGLNIAFLPAYSWARLEPDPTRRARVQTEVLRDAMWSEVDDHKNIFFALIYASLAHPDDDVSAVIASHLQQLALFPPPPNTARPVDNRGLYPEDPSCEGLSSDAIDVDDRVPSTFMWERNPWKLYDPGIPNFLYSGVDYLIVYWMARASGYLQDDAPQTCTRLQP